MSNSHRWLQEHFSDTYVKQAQRQGYPSRAAYKLLEMQVKDKLIRPGMRVLDLGAAPGSWSLVARDLVGSQGQVIAIDLLPMASIDGIQFIQGDFNDHAVWETLLTTLDGKKIDLIISDMAPNISGQKCIDQPRALHLAELAHHCAQQILTLGGKLIVKLFQGEGVQEWLTQLRKDFRQVVMRKPKASRPRSREIYVLAKDFLRYNNHW